MECYSLSVANRENTVSLKERNREWSFRVYQCVCAGVTAESKVALMNESETKRGNAHRLLSVSPFRLQLCLISARVSKLPSPQPCCDAVPAPTWGRSMNWKAPLQNTQSGPQRPCRKHKKHPLKSAKGFLALFFSDLYWCCDSPTGVH